jgi:nucleolin
MANGSSGKKKQTPNAPFRRVQTLDTTIENDALRDNSYQAFDTWGGKASRDLSVTKGKSFKHEKTKKKRGSYKGGQINMGVNSVKFENP